MGAAVALAQATVSTNHRCYAVGQTAQLSGSGFAASSSYTVMLDGVYFGSNSTDGSGNFSIPLHPGPLPKGAAQHTDQVTVDDGTGDTASTSFTLTRSLSQLTALSKTSRGYTGRFKVWGFSLDGSSREVYLHYVGPAGHRHPTVALGQTSGACGTLTSQRELFVPFSLARGTWTLQVDTRPSYAPHPDGPVSRIQVGVG